ncbi:hypothetical protein DKX38_028825 [Salix brachista]|uniref:Uncharacterized protein n=1 Tax=Salix brachista TaxID=2182728 RepID=A0A5N5J9W6_9ROSI|nr:hypothetical protein DKX38_028825 [Salix brachista]
MELQCLHRGPQELPSEVKGRHTKDLKANQEQELHPSLSIDTNLQATSIISYTQEMSNTQEDNKKKVKKGCIAVRVGLEEEDGGFQRFVRCGYHVRWTIFFISGGGLKESPVIRATTVTFISTFPAPYLFTLADSM